MLDHEFQEGMERIKTTFDPYKWDDSRDAEYFRVLRFWDVTKWHKVVNSAIQTCKKMPLPANLIELGYKIDDSEKRTTSVISSPIGHADDACEECLRGARYLVAKVGEQEYERYAACECKAGDKVASHMVQMAKAQGLHIAESQTRYNYLMATS